MIVHDDKFTAAKIRDQAHRFDDFNKDNAVDRTATVPTMETEDEEETATPIANKLRALTLNPLHRES